MPKSTMMQEGTELAITHFAQEQSPIVTGVTMLQLPRAPVLQDGGCHIAKRPTVAFMLPTPLAVRQVDETLRDSSS